MRRASGAAKSLVAIEPEISTASTTSRAASLRSPGGPSSPWLDRADPGEIGQPPDRETAGGGEADQHAFADGGSAEDLGFDRGLEAEEGDA